MVTLGWDFDASAVGWESEMGPMDQENQTSSSSIWIHIRDGAKVQARLKKVKKVK